MQAESPQKLDFGADEAVEKRKPIAIQALREAEPMNVEQEIVPPASEQALAELAPPSFDSAANALDSGFGLAFGGSGQGPGIRGGGGLGGDAGGLVAERAQSDRPAKVVSRPALEYPAEAKRRGIPGTVIVKIRVGANGQAEEIVISESKPKGFFDEAVLNSVRGWRFDPAIVKGQVASSWVTHRVRFEVE